MEQNAYLLERAVIELEREKTLKELSKRVPSIERLDGRRITFFAVQARIDAYKEAHVKRPLVEILSECKITAPTYYDWLEKYNSLYKQCKKI